MFKKIEIWIIYLVMFLSIPFTIGFGVLVRQELAGSTKFGRVSKTALFLAEIPSNLKNIIKSPYQVFERLDRFHDLDGFNGTPNSQESYLLLSRYEGDLKEGVVELVDLKNFNVLHTWNPDIDKFNKSVKKIGDFKYITRDYQDSRSRLLHPQLTSDGGLLFNSARIIKIDSCSNLVFQNTQDKFHHSIERDIEGKIWVPSHMYPQTLPAEKVGRENIDDGGYFDDGIVKLSSDGEILFEKSVSQIFIDNGLEYLLFGQGDYGNDPIHLNDIQPVDFDGEFWKKGDVFLSTLGPSIVVLYRPSTNKIIWKGIGRFTKQHDVDILSDHEISIFNNNSKRFPSGYIVDGHNEIVTYNFRTNQYSTYQSESLIKNDVRTTAQGRSQILPNGDLFLEETDYGRTLYFNSDGSLRWTHINRAENNKIYDVAWSRILYSERDIKIVKNFLELKNKCND